MSKAKKRSREFRSGSQEDYHSSLARTFSVSKEALATGLCQEAKGTSLLRGVYPARHFA